MLPRTHLSSDIEPIPGLDRTLKLGKQMLFVKCYAAGKRGCCRYEVHLSCGRRAAIVDVRARSVDELRPWIEEAAWAFAESLRLAGHL